MSESPSSWAGLVSQFAQAAIMEYYCLCDLNNKKLFSQILKPQSPKSRYPAGLFSDETSLTGLHMAVFLLCPNRAFCLCAHRERSFLCFLVSLWGYQSYWVRTPHLGPHLILIIFLLHILPHWGLRLQHMHLETEETTNDSVFNIHHPETKNNKCIYFFHESHGTVCTILHRGFCF